MIASFLLVGDQPYAVKMVESLKFVHDCHIVQMSDLTTPKINGVDEVVRIPFKIPLMLYRLKHLALYPHSEMLIVDTDVIAKKPITEVLDQSFDVALTRRDDKLMPFNTGVMISRTQTFWKDCYEWLITQDADKQRWYGDQLAVAAVANAYNVLSLPCESFNWSPNSRADTSDAAFWHYKGAIRKKWLLESLSATTSARQWLITPSVSQ